MSTIIKVEGLSKAYQLGEIGTGTLSRDIERWWARVRGEEDPFLKIGETNDRTQKGGSNIVWSLKDLDFEIRQGEAVGIIGRNGAGKSTLLKLLSRVTAPTRGSIKVRGRVASLLEVGTGFHPELTGGENVFLNGAIMGMRKSEIKRKFDEIVSFAGVERYIDTPVKRYSSGMYVRLAFAVAAHLDNEILVVDEVLAVGDAEFQKKCLGKMNEVSKSEGRTILFVSHNLATILNLCNKCIFLERGSIARQGDTQAVVSTYILKDKSAQTRLDIGRNIDMARKASPFFELTGFHIAEALGEDHSVIGASENLLLRIHIDGKVEEVDDRFNIGFTLMDEGGNEILTSYTTDQPQEEWPKFRPGPVSLQSSIDTSILNEGKYFIYLVASLHCVKMFYTPEDNICIGFEIVGNRGNSPYWINKRSSLLAPFIQWKNR
jgi:lipopolysaccharide transport system ATP-binding protein